MIGSAEVQANPAGPAAGAQDTPVRTCRTLST